ncbi:XkdW family protein [Bradyrhizobium commune]|uniref:Bacteriophage SP-beta YorD domain-containing protein n=1 Tax=Bradyrhizobium commune TaxID=83627 RepID=A0A7S9H2G1_9BRAD|nr:hypothetical protein [Bradyrhizobium commune]QPF93775.1 hypothetical protein IC761_11140 [Bradyrhizobium commune]
MAYHPKDFVLALAALRPGLARNIDFEVSDHGDGPFISRWERTDVAQPTAAEVAAVDTDALLQQQVRFVAREMLAQLTPDDYVRIQLAITSNAALGLLWAALLGQGEAPISVGSDRFRQGWAGMTSALGSDRSHAIAAAIGILV